MKHLPYCETETFEVRFDPQNANLLLGEVDVLLPIKVLHASSPSCAHTTFWGQVACWGQQQMSPGLSAGCSVLH